MFIYSHKVMMMDYNLKGVQMVLVYRLFIDDSTQTSIVSTVQLIISHIL